MYSADKIRELLLVQMDVARKQLARTNGGARAGRKGDSGRGWRVQRAALDLFVADLA
jgi:hypothetical protein